jgi:hypothetical protein
MFVTELGLTALMLLSEPVRSYYAALTGYSVLKYPH